MMVEVSNEQGRLRLPARVDATLRPGVCHIPKGLWRRHTGGEFTANVFAPTHEADLGRNACFNDAVVDIRPLP
jgi:anaerobic selenocysteine-containing dehydrogenase